MQFSSDFIFFLLSLFSEYVNVLLYYLKLYFDIIFQISFFNSFPYVYILNLFFYSSSVNSFILLKVVLDQELIVGTLGVNLFTSRHVRVSKNVLLDSLVFVAV